MQPMSIASSYKYLPIVVHWYKWFICKELVCKPSNLMLCPRVSVIEKVGKLFKFRASRTIVPAEAC